MDLFQQLAPKTSRKTSHFDSQLHSNMPQKCTLPEAKPTQLNVLHPPPSQFYPPMSDSHKHFNDKNFNLPKIVLSSNNETLFDTESDTDSLPDITFTPAKRATSRLQDTQATAQKPSTSRLREMVSPILSTQNGKTSSNSASTSVAKTNVTFTSSVASTSLSTTNATFASSEASTSSASNNTRLRLYSTSSSSASSNDELPNLDQTSSSINRNVNISLKLPASQLAKEFRSKFNSLFES